MEGSHTLLLLYAGTALGVSFLCSLLEAGLLSVRMIKLVERAAAGDKGAVRLLAIKQRKVDDALAAILTLNTVANTIGAALAGAEAGRLWGDQRFFVVTLVSMFTAFLAGAILVFSEIVPKTLGAVYAARMVGFVGAAVTLLMWLLRPLLKVTRSITRLLTRGRATIASTSRGEIQAMVAMAARDGALGDDDSRLLANVLRYNEIVVDDVMTPRTVVTMLPQDTTVGAFLADETPMVFSRIPLFDESRDNVTGYVLLREVLIAATRGADPATPIAALARPVLFIPEGQTVGRVMRRLIEQREHMGLVTDEYGGISGIVTLEDLVETTLGVEIIDESDRVADLRGEAVRLRERRLASREAWRRDLGVAKTGAKDTGTAPAESEADETRARPSGAGEPGR